jgi:hypothetical protein
MVTKEYYNKMKQLGLCPNHSNKKAVLNKILCQDCLNSKINKRKQLIKKGKCSSHPNENIVVGKSCCQKCLDKMSNIQETARLNHRCICHPNRLAANSSVLCQFCLDNSRNNHKISKQNSKCPTHPNIDISNTPCQKCVNYKKDYYTNLKNIKMCTKHINIPVVNGKTMCWECLWNKCIKKSNLTDEQATKILEQQHYICSLSGVKLEKGINASPDHIIHRCNGGTDDINNIRFVDKDINKMRSNHSDEEFYIMCKKVADFY